MTAIATTPSADGLTLEDTTVTEEFTIGCLSVPNAEGDTRLMWDSRNQDEVEAAENMFDDLKTKGYAIYKAEGKKGHKGEVIKSFDSTAERLIAVKPLVGG